MRLLIFAVLLYLAWRALKSWMAGGSLGPRSSGDIQSVDDVMVKDPLCGVYFARNEGVRLRAGGEDLYFCSPDCRDRYVTEQGDGD